MSYIRIATAFMFLSVALGAFGAHALQGKLTERYQEVYQTATMYLMITSVGVIALLSAGKSGLLDLKNSERAASILLLGITLFSGSLYAMIATDIKRLGIITPIGGVLLLIGWALATLR